MQAMKVCIRISNLRRSTRSPSTPPQGPTSSTGSVLRPPTVTTCNADVAEPSVRSRTSQPTVSNCSHWALLQQKFPVQSRR